MDTLKLLRNELDILAEKEFEKNESLCNPEFVKEALSIEQKIREAFLAAN